jgi:DNA-directed RNA polymerase specialized sigma24 family protein
MIPAVRSAVAASDDRTSRAMVSSGASDGAVNTQQWWEAELPGIGAKVHEDLRRQFPRRSADHGDIVNLALMRLSEMMRRSEANGGPAIPADDPDARPRLMALARTIAHNAAIDLARKQVRSVVVASKDLESMQAASGEPPADVRMAYADAVRIVMGVLAGATAAEREVFALLIDPALTKSLSNTDRQRAWRLRRKMIRELEARLGSEELGVLGLERADD